MTEDDELRDLLTDAVADVEPEYRLDTIRARTQRPHRRRGWYAAGGAILAAASVVTAVNLAQDDGKGRDKVKPAGQGETHAVALYFVGDTPKGPRLYREFQQLPKDGGPLAALEAITTANDAEDPNYRTEWPASAFLSVDVQKDVIEVHINHKVLDPALPRARFRLALQQVVYTMQAATGGALPVDFIRSGPVAGIWIPPEQRWIEREPQNEVLALVSISDPAEGARVSGSFVARGRANSHEATVPWEIRDESDNVVLEGFVTAEGWMDRLYEWETEPIDVSALPSGRYTFVAMTSDPSGGAEGFGPTSDTRTIIVE